MGPVIIITVFINPALLFQAQAVRPPGCVRMALESYVLRSLFDETPGLLPSVCLMRLMYDCSVV